MPTPPEILPYAQPPKQIPLRLLALCLLAPLAFLALAYLWLNNPVMYMYDGPEIRTFGYLHYLDIKVFLEDPTHPVWTWHPQALTTTILSSLAILLICALSFRKIPRTVPRPAYPPLSP